MTLYTGARGLAQTFLRSAAERGISAAEAIRALQTSELTTYRRREMLADYRQFLGIDKKAGALAGMRMDYRPSKESYTVTKGYQHSKFRYQVNLKIYKPQTGETFLMPTNIASDQQLTRRQLEEAGIDAVSSSIDTSEFEITTYNIFGAFVQEGVIWD